MSITTDQTAHHRVGTSLGVVTALALVACAPEDVPASFEETEPTAAAAEGSTESPETPQTEEDSAEIEDEEDDAEETEDHQQPDRDLSEPVVVQETVWDFQNAQQIDVEVTIDPFMRDSFEGEDYISGHITYEVTSPEGEYRLHEYGTHPLEARLFNPEQPDTVSYPVLASDGDEWGEGAELEHNTAAAGEGPVRWVSIYADPGTDSTAVMLPYIGVVEDVGIVDRDETSPQNYVTLGMAEGNIAEVAPQQFAMEPYRERAGGDVHIRTEEDGQAVITLDAEILFDSDEHTIRDDAEDSLQAAADELGRATGGELLVVGHTDNIDTEEYNQTLSENRAESVREHLDELTDLSAFEEVSTEGRSLREPIATNETDEGRQANRRVELYFTPPESKELDALDEDDYDDGDMPEAQGPVGTADEPMIVTAADGRASEVTVEEVYRLGEVLVGRISVEVTELPEGEDGAGQLAWPLSFGETGIREDHDTEFSAGVQTDALTLLVGDQRIFPLEYNGVGWETATSLEDDDFPWHAPLADRGFGYRAPADVGTRATTTVVWPDVPGETVTIDVPGETEHAERPYSDPFRITDVSVASTSAVGPDAENPDEEGSDEDDDE